MRIYLYLIDTKKYTRVIPRIMWNQRRLPSQTKPTLVKEIILTQEKNQQHLKKHDNATVILGDSMVKDLKEWELLNDKQKVVVKSFSGAKMSHMHWHAKPTIENNPGKYDHSLWR